MGRVLITGASSGLGAEFATQLAERGHDLVLVARRRDRLVELATDLHRRAGVRVEVVTADLSERDDIEKIATRLRMADRPVDLLINNAGFGMQSGITADLAEQERALTVMAEAVLVLSHAAATSMRERGRGGILNVSSVAAYTVMGHYAAIKSWVTVFTEALANEMAGTGVLVTVVCPGLVHTEFHDTAEMGLTKVPEFGWLDAARVVGEALADLDRGRVVSVPSWRYRIGTTVLRHLPRGITRRGSLLQLRSRRASR